MLHQRVKIKEINQSTLLMKHLLKISQNQYLKNKMIKMINKNHPKISIKK